MPKGPEYVAELVFEAICKQTWYQPNSEGSATLSTGRTLWFRNGLILSQPTGPLQTIVVGHYTEQAVFQLRKPGISAAVDHIGGWFMEGGQPLNTGTSLDAIFRTPVQCILYWHPRQKGFGSFEGNQFFWPDGTLAGRYDGEQSGGLATAVLLMAMEIKKQEREAERRRTEQREAERRANAKFICSDCNAIDPDCCSDCGACLVCNTSYGSYCSVCDDD